MPPTLFYSRKSDYLTRANCRQLRKNLLLPFLLVSFTALAQTIRTPGSFSYTALTAYSRQQADAFSFAGNTAAAASIKKFSAGLFSERRFGLKALSSHAAALVLPTASGHFGLRADYLGDAAYNEATAGLAYGRNLGEKAAIGVQFNYFSFSAMGYGAASTVTVDAGAMVRLTPQLQAGLQACNPVGASWGKDGTKRLPSVYRAGVGYDVSDQFYVAAEAEKASGSALGINAGLQYQAAAKLVARAGLRSATSVYYFGFGVQLKQLRFDVTAAVHPYLGLSPGLLMLYSSGK